MKKKHKKISISHILFIALFVLILSVFVPISQKKLSFSKTSSLQIYDRNGVLLREVLSPKQGYGTWVGLHEISPNAIKALIAIEDQRFFRHHGIDVTAILRAAIQNVRAGTIVSGGSTLTQQLVRQIYPVPSGYWGKLFEIWLALRLENTLGKSEILAHYLNRVPFGQQNFGIEAAAQFYFQRPAAHLSLAQAALLAGLPQAPSRLNPLRHPKAAKARMLRVLNAMHETGFIDEKERERAEATSLSFNETQRRFLAPHACEMVIEAVENASNRLPENVYLTIDYALQDAIKEKIQATLYGSKSKNVNNASAVVIENKTGRIVALVGSNNFFSVQHAGQINGVMAPRQPGSAVKPFTYLAAIESGFMASDILPDIPLYFPASGGDFTPQNYDRSHHGPVTLRRALACSYNIPAVWIAHQLGVDQLLQKYKSAGMQSLDKSATHYGLGLTLGNGEVTLLELTYAYFGLAHQGIQKEVRLIEKKDFRILPSTFRSQSMFTDSTSAQIVTHILNDNAARAPAFGVHSVLNLPFDCAVKTGTTKDYRDNWTVGFTRDFTVGVWVGNFDGSSMRHVSGITGAGPIFRDIMLTLHRENYPAKFNFSKLNIQRVCTESGKLPHAFCPESYMEVFQIPLAGNNTCEMHFVAEEKPGQFAVYLQYFDAFKFWADEQGIAMPKRIKTWRNDPSNNLDTEPELVRNSRILFPDEGDIFKVDPVLHTNFQRVQFQAAIADQIHSVKWKIDNEVYACSQRPFSTDWDLKPGEHKLILEVMTTDGYSPVDSLTFVVLK